ncbi:MAG: DNA mismatch repair endonuclease MutL [Candidatus Peregrinibacteria bacterium]|nr:DNA mismatch repair endonuclease MutL [Candidatus Peregrinibacteria bacterium]
MGVIRILPDQLINQIAAGEVIERPASVVKELVENSIDAKATHITVEIQKGGIDKIIITDDGHGMDEMDSRMAFERHATSKIQSVDDLFQIHSLGFRGEALASIGAVSKIMVQTKTAAALSGTRLEMEGGKDPVVTAAGCPVGTKFEISNLFFNTPARKKYMKSDQTEYRHVLETVQDLALAHPEITFKFLSNGRTIFDLIKTEEMTARIGGLFGRSVSSEMVEVFYGGSDLQISGYIGKPHTARATRKYQYFIINGRAVQDHRLAYAIKEGYSNLIPASQHPLFVLSITIDPKRIDVNVHPRKLEVRFENPQEIFRVVKSSVHAALSREQMTQNVPLRDRNLEMPAYLRKDKIQAVEKRDVNVEETGGNYDPTVVEAPTLGLGRSFGSAATVSEVPSKFADPAMNIFGAVSSSDVASTGPSAPPSDSIDARKAYLLQKRAARMQTRGIEPDTSDGMSSGGMGTSASSQPVSSIFGGAASSNTPSASIPPASSPIVDADSFSEPVAQFSQSYSEDRMPGSIEPVAQVNNSYIIAHDDEGIVIIDQHAAHERVMLGQFRASEAEREPAKQPLLTPIQLDLDYREKAVLEENLELLHSIGFELNEFGGNTYTLDAVPDFMAKEDLNEVMKGFIDDLLNEQAPREAARRHEHILHTLACRAAAKFGRRLSTYEQKSLIKSLLETEGSGACAHGRPTMIRLSYNELEQKFGRKG